MSTDRWKVLAPRWIARIWSLGPIFIALANIFGQDEYGGGEMFWYDYLNLGLLFICVVGLAVGWYKERLGARISLVTLLILTIVFTITVRSTVIFAFIIMLGIPAGLYYLAWWMESKTAQGEGGLE